MALTGCAALHLFVYLFIYTCVVAAFPVYIRECVSLLFLAYYTVAAPELDSGRNSAELTQFHGITSW